jgi:hypothetical protein
VVRHTLVFLPFLYLLFSQPLIHGHTKCGYAVAKIVRGAHLAVLNYIGRSEENPNDEKTGEM